jgi:hypothetical protein
MESIIMLVIIGLGVGWIVWRRGRRRQAYAAPVASAGISPETLSLQAFTRGNTYLAEGKFAEAIAAFRQARDLNPKRAHVAARLAEAERRQQEASAPPPLTSPG